MQEIVTYSYSNEFDKPKSCSDCPLRQKSMDGEYCGHKFFKNKGYESFIIEWDKVPEKCPLTIEDCKK
jgi:hypothetical protein